MTSKSKITVASRAHRALRDLSRLRFTTTSSTEISESGQQEELHGNQIGIYENPSGVEPSHIVITDRGLGCIGSSQTRWIHYDEIARIEGPQEKLAANEIVVVLHSGIRMQLRVSGGEGKFRDVFSFVRFLDRVLDDASNSKS